MSLLTAATSALVATALSKEVSIAATIPFDCLASKPDDCKSLVTRKVSNNGVLMRLQWRHSNLIDFQHCINDSESHNGDRNKYGDHQFGNPLVYIFLCTIDYDANSVCLLFIKSSTC